MRVATREWGPGGGREANPANRANRANPPPSDPAPARQVTFQVTYGLRRGANRGNRGLGGGETRRSVSRVQHRDPVIGHGWPWWPGHVLVEEWRSIHIYCSSGVLANHSSGVLATLARTPLERKKFWTPKSRENSEIVKKKYGPPSMDRGVQVRHLIPLFFSF